MRSEWMLIILHFIPTLVISLKLSCCYCLFLFCCLDCKIKQSSLFPFVVREKINKGVEDLGDKPLSSYLSSNLIIYRHKNLLYLIEKCQFENLGPVLFENVFHLNHVLITSHSAASFLKTPMFPLLPWHKSQHKQPSQQAETLVHLDVMENKGRADTERRDQADSARGQWGQVEDIAAIKAVERTKKSHPERRQ